LLKSNILLKAKIVMQMAVHSAFKEEYPFKSVEIEEKCGAFSNGAGRKFLSWREKGGPAEGGA
jgi:hypothetical protein